MSYPIVQALAPFSPGGSRAVIEPVSTATLIGMSIWLSSGTAINVADNSTIVKFGEEPYEKDGTTQTRLLISLNCDIIKKTTVERRLLWINNSLLQKS